ncbi:uncharacterized protein LOC115031116 [Mus caroli]|uniref:Uncharacterized protein LOC115031116 n=1 Tax=Mus caroli TaxID=10089 RepID=A0A6P7QZC2_MUSCR|nr:uncharacterized protein LOC115031116 [Mus caroli]
MGVGNAGTHRTYLKPSSASYALLCPMESSLPLESQRHQAERGSSARPGEKESAHFSFSLCTQNALSPFIPVSGPSPDRLRKLFFVQTLLCVRGTRKLVFVQTLLCVRGTLEVAGKRTLALFTDPRGRDQSARAGLGGRRFFVRSSLPSLPPRADAPAPLSRFFLFSPPFPFLFFSFFPLPPFHHFPSEAFPSGRGRAGLTPRLSPAPAALWREGAPSSPGHQRRRLEERDRRRRPRAQGHHGISSLSDPSAAAVRPARVPAPAGPVCPLLPPQTARPWSRAPRRRAPRIMRW